MNFIDATLIREAQGYWVAAEGFKVQLPDEFHARLAAHTGRPVVFGVRPEDMAARDAGAGQGPNRLAARADVVETLGAETFVYLSCGPHALVARTEAPDRPLSVGQVLEVELKMARTHLFDKETSLTII
jgi:multiple sugar transport system ATP-binding protein